MARKITFIPETNASRMASMIDAPIRSNKSTRKITFISEPDKPQQLPSNLTKHISWIEYPVHCTRCNRSGSYSFFNTERLCLYCQGVYGHKFMHDTGK